jgi:hypothetical protein
MKTIAIGYYGTHHHLDLVRVMREFNGDLKALIKVKRKEKKSHREKGQTFVLILIPMMTFIRIMTVRQFVPLLGLGRHY